MRTKILSTAVAAVTVAATFSSMPLASADEGHSAVPTVQSDSRRATLKKKDEVRSVLGTRLSTEAQTATDAELAAFLLVAKGPIAKRNPRPSASLSSVCRSWRRSPTARPSTRRSATSAGASASRGTCVLD